MSDDFHKTAVLKKKKNCQLKLHSKGLYYQLMGPQMCLNFLRSLASDFPDICLQFFMGNFNFSKFKIFLRTILYIFTRLPTCQGGLQNRDYRNDSI